MEADKEILEMRQRWQENWLLGRLWAVSEDETGMFTVHCHSTTGVAPATSYRTKRAAVARLMQLMDTGVVAPQTTPERVCIGTIEQETQT